MAYYEIPTGPSPRVMRITIQGVQYGLRLAYADAPEGGWFMDLGDSSGNPLACGIPLTTGCDLLEQLEYLGVGGRLWVQSDADPGLEPTFDSLGVTSHLYFEAY